MATKPTEFKCPNCLAKKTEPQDACVLEALGRVLIDRDLGSPERVMEFLESVDVDVLWDVVGPVIDQLEAEDRKSVV